MAFTQSHHTNGVHAFKTFTATPSNADNAKPVREIVLMPDEEPAYCPSSLSVYSEYELGLMKAPSAVPTINSASNNSGCAVTSPNSHDHAPPSYQQYIAQQQQQRQMQQQQQHHQHPQPQQQHQQHVSLVSSSITSPTEQQPQQPVISNSYAEVVFHQRAPVRRTSEYSGSSGASRNMRPPPSPQPRPPIPTHSPNSKLRNHSDSSHGSYFTPISPQAPPPPPPPHGRPLSGTAVLPRTSPSSCSTSSSSVIPMFASSVPTSAAPSSVPQYFHYNNLNQPPTEVKGYANPSMAFPVSRSRVISRSNDNLAGQSSNATTISVNVNTSVLNEPPRLPPQSGVFNRTSGKVVLKPHAFKPVTPRSQSGTASCNSSPLRVAASPTSPAVTSPDPNRSIARPRSQATRSQDGSSGVSSSCGPGLAPMPEIDLNSLENGLDSYPTLKPTPSTPVHSAPQPVSNGVVDPLTSPSLASSADRELLRQRETELATLRRTMEQNEEAMMRVFEERRNELERQLSHERQVVSKMETALQSTTVQLRQAELRLADSQAQLHQRQTRATPPQAPPHANSRPPSMSSIQKREMGTQASCEIEQLHVLQRELTMRAALFEEERNQWLEEKSKVISYQKQMQLNYVQLCSKTQRLEAEVQQLTLDLERKELQLSNLQEASTRA